MLMKKVKVRTKDSGENTKDSISSPGSVLQVADSVQLCWKFSAHTPWTKTIN